MPKCMNCRGTGYVAFSNKGGICFECNGKGKVAQIKAETLRSIIMRNHEARALFTAAEVEANIQWGEAQLAKGKSMKFVLNAFNNSADRRAAQQET